jgi:ornithine cyclodeaminase/alanine dehydrogenase-like protein (mu-crystallin family)
MALLLTDDDVRELLSMADAVDCAETALKEFQAGRAENLPRHHFYANGAGGTFFLRNFQGAIPQLGVAGIRLTTDLLGSKTHRPDQRPFGAFLLFDLDTAALLAVIHDHELQRIRVGAETGVGIRHLARTDASLVGILGSGFQAESQLAAACAVRAICAVEVFSPNAERRAQFARRMEQRFGVPVSAVASAREAVSGKDIVLAATNSSSPVLDGSWIAAGAHVTSIVNSDQRFPRRELDDATFARAHLVAIGYLEQTRKDHAADIFEAVKAGALDWARVCQLGEILIGARAGRTRPDDITVFKNNGLAVEFVALAAKVYRLALERGRGEEIPANYFSGLRSPTNR